MAKKVQDIKIFETAEKEFVVTKSFIKTLIVLMVLTVIAILNICKLDVAILSLFVKLFELLDAGNDLIIKPLIVVVGIFIFLLTTGKQEPVDKNKKYLSADGRKKDNKKFWLQVVIFVAVILVFVVFDIIGLILAILLKIFNALVTMHTIFIYISIVYLIVTYFVQDSLAGDLAEKKGYTRFVGALWGLIPFYGLIKYARAPKRRNVQNSTIRNTYSPKEIFTKYLIFTELTVLVIIVLLPVIYLIGASFTNQASLPTTFWPDKARFTFKNYSYLVNETKYLTWFKNTFIIATINMIGGVLFITGAGYVFARFKFKGKKIGLITILVLQVFPTFMGMVALFTLYETFGLVGHPTALTIIYVGGSIPFNLWLIKGYLQQIPKDLDESAMLDGANKIQIFFKIILPLSVPILSFVAVSLFMSPWMDYILPSYLLDILPASKSHLITGDVTADDLIKEQWTLAVGLYSMISDANSADYTTFAAGSIIIAAPITILYMIFQRFLIEGITAGATKG